MTTTQTEKQQKLLEALAELESFIRGSGDKNVIKAAKKLVKNEEAKDHPDRPGPVRQRKLVHKTIICRHCHSTKESMVYLTTNEHTQIVNREGKYVEIHFRSVSEPCRVTTYTSMCSDCATYVRQMYRDELEHRYLNLLNEVGMRREDGTQT